MRTHPNRFSLIFFLLLIMVGMASFTLSGISSPPKKVYVVQLNDFAINPIVAQYIENAIQRAQADHAQCLIIQLDTPGGLLSSTRSIVKSIMTASVPVVVYIHPSGSRAGSAGVFITYAAHIAVMAPSTNIGAAHPVAMGGARRFSWPNRSDEDDDRDQASEPSEDKILNDTIAFIKTLADERQRNADWAEESVRASASITEKEALAKNVINFIARDIQELLEKINGQVVRIGGEEVLIESEGARVVVMEMDSRQKLLNVLGDPNIAYILMILGFYGLLYEITNPGIGVPGVLGTIFLVLSFYSMQTLPTNYAGVALIGLGVILFVAEAMVPGFGLLTLGGLVSMVLGSLILFDTAEPIMRVSWALIASFPITTAGITIFLVRAVTRAHRQKTLSGKEGLIGSQGIVNAAVSPEKEGKVFVHGELWNAISEEKIKKNEMVIVTGVERLTLRVKKKGGKT